MYAIKGSWAGQTFALTKGNDSGGKKSRVRRSKDERKALVESFIKKHQKLNNGSFPSLNLTHKEVGGSFYTVREIIREVIQENKVLGPGNPDILKQHLFGSTCIEHESGLFSANDSPPVNRIFPHYQDIKKIPSDVVEGLENEQYSLGDELYLDGPSEVLQQNKAHGGDRDTLILEKGAEDTEVSSVRVTNLEAAFTVETSLTYELNDNFRVFDRNFGEKGGKSSVVDGVNYLENGSNLGNELNDESFEDKQLSSDLLEDTLVGKHEVPLEKILDNYITEEGSDNRKEPVFNASTQSLEHEHQSFIEELQISRLGKGFEKNEGHEDMRIGSGNEEILKLKEKPSNGSVLYENFGNKEEESSIEESVLNANTQGLEHDELNFGEELQISGLGKGFEKNEAHEDMCLEFGDREILEIKKESDNRSVVKENFAEGERYVEEPVLNANTQSLELEHDNFSQGLELSGLVKGCERSEEIEDMRLGSGDRKIINLEENSSNGSALSENLEKGEVPELDKNSSYGVVLNEKSEGKSSNTSFLNENLEKEEIQELKGKSSNGSVRKENVEKGEISGLDEKSSNVSSAVDETKFQESASDLTDARKIADVAVRQLEYCGDLVIEKPEIAVKVPLEEIPKVSMVIEGTEDKVALIAGVQIADPINGVHSQMFKDSKISSSKQTISKMVTANKSNSNIQVVDDLEVPNSTLDRMNLESWKRTSDKPANPFLAYFKAFVAAVVKFWSE